MEEELMNLESYNPDLETPISEDKPALTKTKDLIEVIGKIVIGIVALCYVLGLVVVNIYLSRYGVYSLSLFRLNYIMAGFWLLTSVFIGALTVFIIAAIGYSIPPLRRYIHSKLRTPPHEEHSIHFTQKHAGLFVIQAGGLTVLVFFNIKKFGIDLNSRWAWSVIGSILIVLTIIWLFFLLVKSTSSLRFPYSLPVFLCCVLLFIVLVFDFANNLYDTIPPHLGGGAPKIVQFLLDVDDSKKKYFEKYGLKFEKDSNLTNRIRLILSTDNEYIVWVESFVSDSTSDPTTYGPITGTLSIPRGMVQSVLYESHYLISDVKNW